MKTATLRLRALFLLLMLLAGPAWAQPTWQWASQAVPNSSTGESSISAMTREANGTTIVTGAFIGSISFGATTLVSQGNDYDVFVAWLSPAGQWIRAVRGGGSTYEMPTGIAVDGAGAVTVVGMFDARSLSTTFSTTFGTITLNSTGATSDSFVARLSPTGTWTQAVRVGGTGTWVTKVVLDSAGDALVTGTFNFSFVLGTTTLTSTTASRDNLFVARLNPAGQWTQAVQAGDIGSTNGNYSASAMAVDAAGNLVIVGYFNNTAHFGSLTLTSAGEFDVFVARLSPTGQWTQAVRAGGTHDDFGRAVSLDAVGNVVVAGAMGGDGISGGSVPAGGVASFGGISLTGAGLYDAFVARLSPAGIWLQAAQAGGSGNDMAATVAVNAAGEAIVGGAFGSSSPNPIPVTATFGATTLTSAGQYDAFVGRLSATGQWMQAVQAGGLAGDGISALSLDATGNAVVAGSFVGPVNFGPFTLTGNTQTAFAARLTGLTLATRTAAPTELFTLAPNPTTANVRLTWPTATAAPCPVQVLDGLGRPVRQQLVPAHATTAMLDVQGLASGLYTVRYGTVASKLVVE